MGSSRLRFALCGPTASSQCTVVVQLITSHIKLADTSSGSSSSRLGPESQFLVAVREPPATRHSASRRGGSGMMSSSLADLLRTPAHAPALRVPACARVGRRRAAGVTGSYAPCSFFFFLFAPLMHAPVRTTALRLWATSWAVREFSSCSQVQDLRPSHRLSKRAMAARVYMRGGGQRTAKQKQWLRGRWLGCRYYGRCYGRT
jgi:hypothetical protein